MMEGHLMNCSKQYIADISEETGFLTNNIEKVIRLLDVLDFIFSKSSFKDALCLKGGTSINLIHTNLKRLSVDIDLDYHRSLDKDKALKDKELIVKELDNYMKSEGYLVSDKSRGSAILASRTYSYLGASGNNDNIKIDINFINRISLYPCLTTQICYFGKTVNIVSLSKEELYGMKIAAVIDRSKPRDLYDANYLFDSFGSIDFNKLRKAVLFYLSLDGIYNTDESLFNGIKSVDGTAIKKELLPVLKKGEKFNLFEVQQRIIKELSILLLPDRNESLYLEEFSKGNYNPSLLLDSYTAERAEKHPMAKWRTLNNKK